GPQDSHDAFSAHPRFVRMGRRPGRRGVAGAHDSQWARRARPLTAQDRNAARSESMRACLYLVPLCAALAGCGRDFTEYDLDERSFGADTMARIQQESGIQLPEGSKGL